MVNKIYSVTLDIDEVKKAKQITLGAKLSPIINELIILYNQRQREIMDMINEKVNVEGIEE